MGRIRAIFTWRKLPGLAIAALGLIWRFADYSGRVDILVRVAESMGGTPTMLVAILLSPLFGIGLIIVGVGYVAFIGEPPRGVQRHVAWTYVGWAIFGICFVAMVGILTAGGVELYIRTEIAKGNAGVPRSASPASPGSGSSRPIYSQKARELTVDQQRILISEGAKIHNEFKFLQITYLDTDMETFAVARQFNATFQRAAINSGVASQSLGEPDWDGILIEVPDPRSPNSEGKAIQQLLLLADIPTKFVNKPDRFSSQPVVLFVGPRPIQR